MKAKVIATRTKEFDLDIDDTVLTEEYFREFSKGLWKMENEKQMVEFIANVVFDEGGRFEEEGIGVLDRSCTLTREEGVSVAYRLHDQYTEVEWDKFEAGGNE